MIQAINNQLSMMSTREKVLVSVGAFIGITLLYWSFVWKPLQKRTLQLQNQQVKYQQEHRYMQKLQQQIQQARQQQQNIPKRSMTKQNSAQFIENKLLRHNLRQHIKSMSGNSTISLNLTNINMDVFSRFLGDVEKHPNLSILKLEIKPLKIKGRINTKMKLGKAQ